MYNVYIYLIYRPKNPDTPLTEYKQVHRGALLLKNFQTGKYPETVLYHIKKGLWARLKKKTYVKISS